MGERWKPERRGPGQALLSKDDPSQRAAVTCLHERKEKRVDERNVENHIDAEDGSSWWWGKMKERPTSQQSWRESIHIRPAITTSLPTIIENRVKKKKAEGKKKNNNVLLLPIPIFFFHYFFFLFSLLCFFFFYTERGSVKRIIIYIYIKLWCRDTRTFTVGGMATHSSCRCPL